LRRAAPTIAAVVVAAAAAAAFATAGLEFGKRADNLFEGPRDAPDTPLVDRALAGGYGIDISRDFLVAARAFVPPGARYAVETGAQVDVSTPLTLTALPSYSRFWLMPRRQVAASLAEWLLCYGCDLERWRTWGTVVWEQPGLAIVRRSA
jgi:hypothetical protein